MGQARTDWLAGRWYPQPGWSATSRYLAWHLLPARRAAGGKAVLKAVYDTMLAGDTEPIPMIDRPTAVAMRAATDPRQFLARYARMGREMYERVGPLLPTVLTEGAAGDREVRAFTDTIENERAVGTAGIIALLHERFGLRAGLTVADAADILWTLTAPDLLLRLVHRRGWSLDKFEAWLADAMADALLPARPPA